MLTIAVVLSALTLPAIAANYSPPTAAERTACIADAFLYCFNYAITGDHVKVAYCLVANKHRLGSACYKVLIRRGM